MKRFLSLTLLSLLIGLTGNLLADNHKDSKEMKKAKVEQSKEKYKEKMAVKDDKEKQMKEKAMKKDVIENKGQDQKAAMKEKNDKKKELKEATKDAKGKQ